MFAYFCLYPYFYKSNSSLLFLQICHFNWKLKRDFRFLRSLPKSATTAVRLRGTVTGRRPVGGGECEPACLHAHGSFLHHNLLAFIYIISLYAYVIVFSDGFPTFLFLFAPTLGRQIKWIKEKWKKKFPGFKTDI